MKIVLIISFLISIVSAQEISTQEAKLMTLEKSYSIEKSKLDSINNVLQTQIDELDLLKKAEQRDEDKIALFMSRAHSVSKLADSQTEVVTNLAVQIKKHRIILYNRYSAAIDSLADEQKQNDEGKLKELNYKRSLVSPALPLFSFDPVLIERIDLANTENSLEKSIHHDYLTNALSEIDSNIKVLNRKKDEVSTMIRLNEQTEDFIDDLDGTQFFSSIEFESQNKSNFRFEQSDHSGAGFGVVGESDKIIQLYDQLQPVMGELIEAPGITNTDSLASDEYLKLLQGTEKTLKLYRKLIQDKMDRD
ncbi:MAG: hypothetical protein D8M58_21260 [Calditrichaeota bacterium]|nr:MAG: hypothetical protein DWQ03_16975 [Calditrichota bacterium]MBL1207942.1 hypothetical protein [Calditrichota bacterium]NOG47778.1 hypothetical protein [Calditrichota bacterium]